MGNHALRMGKVMPHTSEDGAEHAESFWCLNRLDANIGDGTMALIFIGYHDVASYDDDKQPIAGAIKHYIVSGTAFQQAINMVTQYPLGTPISAEILAMAWVVALNTKDIGNAPATGQPDSRTSFFETATGAA